MRALPARLCALQLALLGVAPAVFGAGAGIPDLGAAALGEAGANVARPSDLTALYYNPAALTALPGLTVYLDGRAVGQKVYFQRLTAAGANLRGWQPVENLGNPSVAPIFGISYLFDRPGWVPVSLALGGFPQNGATGYRYNDPHDIRANGGTESDVAQRASQRYLSIASSSKIYIPAAAIAAQLLPWLSLGAELQLPIASFNTRQAVYAGLVSGEDTAFDATIDVKGTDTFARSGLFGVSLTPLPWLSAGASLQLQTHFRARGTIEAQLPPSLDKLITVQGDRIGVDVIFPWVARAGVRVTRGPFSVELAGTYERWSLLKQIRVDIIDVRFTLGNTSTALPPIAVQKDFQDAGSVRLGGEWKAGSLFSSLDFLTVRAGILGESNAIPEQRQALDWAHWERLSVNFGLGAELGRWTANFGIGHFLQADRQVRDSLVAQVAALPGVTPTVVGNGNYGSDMTVVALGLSTHFDPQGRQ